MPRKKVVSAARKGWSAFEQQGKEEVEAPIEEAITPEAAPPPPKKSHHKRKPEERAAAVPPIPQVEVWERRLINPVQRGSRMPRLKQPGFEVRIINTDGTPNRYQEAIHSQGWIPMRIADLIDPTEIPGLVDKADGLIRTGPNGVYLWCKMPKTVYDAIAKRKVEISQANRRSQQKSRERIMRAAEQQQPGGAERVASLKGEITEMRESIDMDPSDLEANLPTADGPVSRSELS